MGRERVTPMLDLKYSLPDDTVPEFRACDTGLSISLYDCWQP